MAESFPLRVLVVEDDPDTRANLRDILELDDYEVEEAGTAAEALGRDDWSRLSAVLLDRKLPDGSAEELLPRLRERAPGAAVLVVTGYADLQGAIAALRQGAADYILKPINPAALRASLERVRAARALARAKERSEAAFRTLVEAAPCMIVILRPDHTILYFSPFAEELTGHAAADVLGQDYFRLFLPEEHHAAVAEDLRRVLAGTPTRGFENPVVCRDGSRRWMIWNVECLADYEGGPAALVVGQDITALLRAQERTLQGERLAAIGQMVTGLAHESGNALARSQACLEMLALDVQDRPEALGLVTRVQNAQDHLRQLYEEVRGYAAPLRLDREVCDLGAVWRQAWTNLEVLRRGRQARLCERTGGVDLRCPVDPFRMQQVFRNVLENALAAGRDPLEVTVACSEATLDPGCPAVRVCVRDNGPGLTAEQRQRIFEPFFTTKTKGTGLGMAIAKRIVEAHGGQIAVGPEPRSQESGGGSSLTPDPCLLTPGRGAEIVITLPRESS
jgi:two-component system, LuxR family, sensor kinase FixL